MVPSPLLSEDIHPRLDAPHSSRASPLCGSSRARHPAQRAPPPHLLGISCSARFPQTPRRREAGAGSLSAQGHRTAGESQNPPASARLPPPWPRAAPWTPLPLFSVTWIRKTFVHSDRSCETLHFRERLAGSSSRVGSCSLRPVLQLGGAPWPPRDRARAALSPAPAGCPPARPPPAHCSLRPRLGTPHSLCSAPRLLLFAGSPVTLCHHGHKQCPLPAWTLPSGRRRWLPRLARPPVPHRPPEADRVRVPFTAKSGLNVAPGALRQHGDESCSGRRTGSHAPTSTVRLRSQKFLRTCKRQLPSLYRWPRLPSRDQLPPRWGRPHRLTRAPAGHRLRQRPGATAGAVSPSHPWS